MKKEKLQKREQEKSQLKADHPSGENREVAISVKNVSKTFQVPHEKVDSVRSAFINALNTRGQSFEEFHALEDVSFEVKKGEFLGIIGNNGAGKSTLLKVLAGVYNADGGSIEVNGLISPFLELGIGFNMELSGRDNIYLNATVLGLKKKQIDEKFDEIVAFAELEQFIDQQLKNYSSGMKARLAFAVSISANRDILLMDEVLAVGDNRFQEKCLKIFEGYRDQGRTVILVTHGIPVVREYCDRALLLDHGKLLDIGDVDEVVDAYILNNLTKDQRKELKEREKKALKEREHVKELKGLGKLKEAEVVSIELLNSDKDKNSIFSYHDVVEVKINFTTNNISQKEFNIGLSIEDAEGSYIFRYTTERDDYIVDVSKKYISFNVKLGNFMSKKNYINVTLYGNDNSIIYDHKPKISSFRIESKLGVARSERQSDLEHEWKIN